MKIAEQITVRICGLTKLQRMIFQSSAEVIRKGTEADDFLADIVLAAIEEVDEVSPSVGLACGSFESIKKVDASEFREVEERKAEVPIEEVPKYDDLSNCVSYPRDLISFTTNWNAFGLENWTIHELHPSRSAIARAERSTGEVLMLDLSDEPFKDVYWIDDIKFPDVCLRYTLSERTDRSRCIFSFIDIVRLVEQDIQRLYFSDKEAEQPSAPADEISEPAPVDVQPEDTPKPQPEPKKPDPVETPKSDSADLELLTGRAPLKPWNYAFTPSQAIYGIKDAVVGSSVQFSAHEMGIPESMVISIRQSFGHQIGRLRCMPEFLRNEGYDLLKKKFEARAGL